MPAVISVTSSSDVRAKSTTKASSSSGVVSKATASAWMTLALTRWNAAKLKRPEGSALVTLAVGTGDGSALATGSARKFYPLYAGLVLSQSYHHHRPLVAPTLGIWWLRCAGVRRGP